MNQEEEVLRQLEPELLNSSKPVQIHSWELVDREGNDKEWSEIWKWEKSSVLLRRHQNIEYPHHLRPEETIVHEHMCLFSWDDAWKKIFDCVARDDQYQDRVRLLKVAETVLGVQ